MSSLRGNLAWVAAGSMLPLAGCGRPILVAGDVIACGTSTGAMPMRPGVTIEVEIPGIGVLANALQSTEGSESEAGG